MPNETVDKIWGLCIRVFESDPCVVDLLKLECDTFCSKHYHKRKFNKFLVISGRISIETEYGKTILGRDESLVISPPAIHRFKALEDSTVLEIAWVDTGKIEVDIIRKSQGGKIVNGREMTENELRNKKLLEL